MSGRAFEGPSWEGTRGPGRGSGSDPDPAQHPWVGGLREDWPAETPFWIWGARLAPATVQVEQEVLRFT